MKLKTMLLTIKTRNVSITKKTTSKKLSLTIHKIAIMPIIPIMNVKVYFCTAGR